MGMFDAELTKLGALVGPLGEQLRGIRTAADRLIAIDDGFWVPSPRQTVSLAREIIQLRVPLSPQGVDRWIVQALIAWGIVKVPTTTPFTFTQFVDPITGVGTENYTCGGVSGFSIIDNGTPIEVLAQSADPLLGFNPDAIGQPIFTVLSGKLINAFTLTHEIAATPLVMPVPGFVLSTQQTVQFRWAPFPTSATPGPLDGSYMQMAAYVVPRMKHT